MDWPIFVPWSREAFVFSSLIVITHAIPWLDAVDVALRLFLLRVRGAGPTGDHGEPATPAAGFPGPYAIIVSVHNMEGRLGGFLEGLGPHRDRLFVVDDASTDRTSRYLERENVPVIRVPKNLKKPSALRELLASLPEEIGTVVVLDPDVVLDPEVTTTASLDEFVLRFERSGFGAACPRITADARGVLGQLQALEYDVSMLVGRRSLRDISTTSGVAFYRRDALTAALDAHSRSVYAEDLENAFLLLTSGEHIYFDKSLVFRAQVPDSWNRWFSQRVGWSYGLIRAYLLYGRKLWRAHGGPLFVYQYIVYLGVMSIALHPVRVASLLLLTLSAVNAVDTVLGSGLIPDSPWTSPYLFCLAYVQYTILITVTALVISSPGRRREHLRVIPIYFFYVLAGVVPTTVGFLNWLTLRYARRRLYRDHYTEASMDDMMAGTGAP